MTIIVLLGVVLLWAFFVWGFLRVPPRSSWVIGLVVGVSVPFLTKYYPPLVVPTNAGQYFLFDFFEMLFRLDTKRISHQKLEQLHLLVSFLVKIPFYGLIVGTIANIFRGRKIKSIQLVGIFMLIIFFFALGYIISSPPIT